MPLPPSTWTADMPVTAKQLNTDLYTYTPGNNHTPNGILFHANHPTYFVSLQSGTAIPQATLAGGTWTAILGTSVSFDPGTIPTPTNWKSWFDSATLFSNLGSDYPSNSASGSFVANVPASAGTPIVGIQPGTAGTPATCVGGGYYLAWGFPAFGPSSSAGAAGAAFGIGGQYGPAGSVPNVQSDYPPTNPGAIQLASTVNDNCAYAVDLFLGGTIEPGGGGGQPLTFTMFGYSASTGSSYPYIVNQFDYSGETVRFAMTWCCVSTGGATVSTLPVPQPSYSSTSTITSAFLNSGSGIAGPLTFLNNPPVLRIGATIVGTIAATTATVLSFPAIELTIPPLDSYTGSIPDLTTYTVPISGLYFCHGKVAWAANSTASTQFTGLRVNGTAYWGPAYQNISVSPSASSFVRFMDLNAGDTVNLLAYTTSTAQLMGTAAFAYDSKMLLMWTGSLGSPTTAWSVPDTSFRWQAGVSGTALVSQFNTHLANDLSFLMQRPYVMASQSSAALQTGLTAGSFVPVTMDKITGPIHGSTGDNYGGWSAPGNRYIAPVNGWYMVTAGYYAGGTGTPHSIVAGILQSPAGSVSPDWYQHISFNSTATSGGAEAIGLYYLRAGDSVAPTCTVQSGGTWSTKTSLSGTTGSHFGVVWLSK